MSPGAFTFAFVAGYLALGVVVALLLGRMIALRDRQVPRTRPSSGPVRR
ncbi:MAG: hypothetical protein L0I76_31390 [Pseudonocardia sp.]|nr:hypothetical protein [Pseudonocardia sp.]